MPRAGWPVKWPGLDPSLSRVYRPPAMMPHVLAALLAAGAAATPPAPAPVPAPDPAELRRSCRDDAFRLCPGQVALARREGVKRCLAANRAKLSPICRTAFPGD